MYGERNELSVWNKGYLPFRPTNLIYNVKNFFRNIKYAWQRARYGYCDMDVWNLDLHLLVLFRETLYHLAEKSQSHPYYKTPEEWEEELIKAADDFHFSIQSNYNNLYNDEYIELMKEGKHNLEEGKKLWKKIMEVEAKNFKEMTDRRTRALDWLSKNFQDLWD